MKKIITKNEVFMTAKNSTKRVAISAEVLIFLGSFLMSHLGSQIFDDQLILTLIISI
jgi:hypothetical protein